MRCLVMQTRQTFCTSPTGFIPRLIDTRTPGGGAKPSRAGVRGSVDESGRRPGRCAGEAVPHRAAHGPWVRARPCGAVASHKSLLRLNLPFVCALYTRAIMLVIVSLSMTNMRIRSICPLFTHGIPQCWSWATFFFV